MVTNMSNEHVFQFSCISTDKKPIGINCEPNDSYEQYDYIIEAGSTLIETDTGNVFILQIEENSEEKKIASWKSI